MTSGSHWSEAFIRQLADKELRDEYAADQVRNHIAPSAVSQAESGTNLEFFSLAQKRIVNSRLPERTPRGRCWTLSA